MTAPLLDHDPGLRERIEDLAVEQLVTELAIEALHIAVLPGARPFDEGRLGAHRDDPLSHRLCDELRALIRADMIGSSPFETEVRQGLDNIEGAEAAGDPDRQALPRELVH